MAIEQFIPGKLYQIPNSPSRICIFVLEADKMTPIQGIPKQRVKYFVPSNHWTRTEYLSPLLWNELSES